MPTLLAASAVVDIHSLSTTMETKSSQVCWGLFMILLCCLVREGHTVICPSLIVPLNNNTIKCCSLSATNISNTAILLQWSPISGNGLEHTIEYYQIEPEVELEDDGILNQLGTAVTIPNANSRTSAVLLALEQNSCYFVEINNPDIVCCRAIFSTADEPSINQVENVMVHEYYPILNSTEILSAQIDWRALSASLQLVSYDVMVRTADSNLENITGESLFNLTPKEAHTNIVIKTESNELIYPLRNNRTYIVQVRGQGPDQNMQYTWSEPVLIDTIDLPKWSGVYAVSNGDTRLIHSTDDDYLIRYNSGLETSPFALDKINRNIFYFNELETTIEKINLDLVSAQETFFALPNNHTVYSMAYDWISQKLYIAVGSGNGYSIYYLVNVDSNRQLIHVCDVPTRIFEMIVNPFTGYIHWTESIGNSNVSFQLKQYNIVTKEKKIVQEGSSLILSSLTENVARNCVYVTILDPNEIQGIGEGGNCDIISINPSPSDFPYFMAADERGVHVGHHDGLLRFDYENSFQLNDGLSLNDIIGLDTVSPGTQPLPNQSCLSPHMTEGNATITIKERTSSSLYMEWTTPRVRLTSECEEIVASMPPLMYVITVSTNDGTILQKAQYDPSLNITGLDSSLMYDTSIKIKTAFTFGAEFEYPLIAQLTIEPIGVINPSQTRTSTRISSTNIPPSTDTNGGIINSTYIAIVSGCVVLCTILLVFCCCCCCCCCIHRRKKSQRAKTCDDKTKQRHYVKQPSIVNEPEENEEDNQPVYVLPGETPIYDLRNPQSFIQNKDDELLASYDYPSIMGSHTSMNSEVANSNSYDYARTPLHTSKLPSYMSPKSVASSSLSDTDELNEYPPTAILLSNNRPAGNSRLKDRVSLAHVNRVSQLLQTRSMEDLPVSKNENGGKQDEEEELYVYEMLTTEQSPPNSTHNYSQEEDDIYEECIPSAIVPNTPKEYSIPVTMTTTSSITQMPLPSLPAETAKSQLLGPLPPLPRKEKDAPVDSAGYLIVQSANNVEQEEGQYDNPDIHRGHSNSLETKSSEASCLTQNTGSTNDTYSVPN